MSVKWEQEWKVESSSVTEPQEDDWIKFEGPKILLKKKGTGTFFSWAENSSTAPKTRVLTLGSLDYTIEYKENSSPDPDQLKCYIDSGKFSNEASATSRIARLSWILGGSAGVALGVVLGLFLDVPWDAALAIAFAAASITVISIKIAESSDPTDPPNYPDGPPSWTAIEGG